MRAAVLAGCLLCASLAHGDPPSRQRFTLHKFQNRIGVESSVDDGREIRTAFTFTDRRSSARTIKAGKRADFLLVDGDPLADIRALRRIRVVVAGGRACDRAALWRSVGFTP